MAFRRPFPNMAAARRCAGTLLPSEHSHRDNASLHLSLSRHPRPSDYPVLFHLQRAGSCKVVFDLGGNTGNLFYLYERYLGLGPDICWRVHDLPEMMQIGAAIARERCETRITFVDSIREAEGTDVILASGSLHYFEEDLSAMISGLRHRPRHVLVNRTPLVEGSESYTIQDAGTFLVPCRLINATRLTSGMEALGYECIDQWTVPELSLILPAHASLSAPAYTGLYFRLC